MRQTVLLLSLLLAGTGKAATPFPLGTYVGNPHATDAAAMERFKAQYRAHVAALGGARPRFFNSWTDFRKDPSQWASSANWGASSAVKSGDDYYGPGSGVIPVIGLPLSAKGQDFGNVDLFYRDAIAGRYDAAFAGIADAWLSRYKTVDFRIAYEMNGNFMPWAPGNSKDPQAKAHFVQAFRHVADILHAEARKKGRTALVHWNPVAINSTGYDVNQLYPGDDVVDVVSVDQYSPIHPLDLTDWSNGGHVKLTLRSMWVASPENRMHAWRFPQGTYSRRVMQQSNWGWSIPQTIALAKQHGKPLGIDETGVGLGSGGGIGQADDPEFPKFLAGMLNEAQAQGVKIRNVMIWDTQVGDGDWAFANGRKPLTAAAWRTYFGERPGRAGVR